jgi:voltage-gated sodium channel
MTDQTVEHQHNTLRERVRAFVESSLFRNTIMALIIFNAITLGLGTSAWMKAHFASELRFVDQFVLAIFVVELSLKFYVERLSFFRSAWNVFDLCIVSVGLLPQSDGLTALRGLRVIRAMRLLSAFPQMRAVVQALLDALPGMGAVIIMLLIVYYVFGVMATIMFGSAFADWFGTVGKSIYSLFQIMTLESWSMGIVRPVMEQYPFAWAFFVPFIIVTAFSVLNLFIGLLVNTMQSAVEQDTEAEFQNLRDLIREETNHTDEAVYALQEEIRALRAELREARSARE